MTRQFITRMVKELLGEIPLSAGDAAPVLYDTYINAGADELAEKTDSWWITQKFSTVANQADYCADEADPAGRAMIYRIRGATWYDSDNAPHPLYARNTQQMDWARCGWRDGAVGNPTLCVYKGLNRITLNAAPDTTGTNNVWIEGYAKPYQSWPLQTDECPLPGGDSIHMAVAYYVAAKRAVIFNKDPVLAAAMNAEYMRIKGQLEKTALENNDSMRYGDVQTKQIYGFGYGY